MQVAGCLSRQHPVHELAAQTGHASCAMATHQALALIPGVQQHEDAAGQQAVKGSQGCRPGLYIHLAAAALLAQRRQLRPCHLKVAGVHARCFAPAHRPLLVSSLASHC